MHLLLGAPMRVPIIHPDELGYLDNARYLARGGVKPETQYYPGFSLLLVPFWLLRDDPAWVWRAALDVNAILAAGSALVTWMLCPRLVPTLRGWRRLAVAIVASLYPAALLYSDLALSEVLFALLFGAVVLAAGAAVERSTPLRWGVLGALTGALVLVHPRGLAVIVAVGLLAAVVLRGTTRATASGAALATGLTLALGVTRVLVSMTRGPTLVGFAAYEPDSVLSRSLSLHGLVNLAWAAAGQLFYLSVATVGLVPLALFLGLRSAAALRRGNATTHDVLRAFCTLAFAGVWALSSMYMNLGARPDKLVYGRYNEAVIAPLLVLALADLLGADGHRRFSRRGVAARRLIVVGALTTVVAGDLVLLAKGTHALHGELNAGNVLALYPIVHHSGWIDVPLAGALAVGAIVVLALIAWRAPIGSALIVVGALFLAGAMFTETQYLTPGSRSRARENVIATALLAATRAGMGAPCVGFDPSERVQFNYFGTRFLDPAQAFAWIPAGSSAPPCGSLVMSGQDDFPKRFPGARRVIIEDDVDVTLWSLPGSLQDRLAQAGWLLADPPSAPLPVEARQASVTVPAVHGTINVAAGGRRDVGATVRHDGAGSPWLSAAGLKQGDGAVRVAVRWYPQGGVPPVGLAGQPLRLTTVELPRSLLPGQSTRLSVPLVARDDAGHPLPDGDYDVDVAVYQEGGPGFTDAGFVIPVAVR